MNVQSYRDLLVWQRAVALTLESYRLSGELPASERYGLASQIRRASVAVPANIAEGHGRTHRGAYAHHLSIARGSLMELETHFVIAEGLHYLTAAQLKEARELADAIGRMLTRLKRSLVNKRRRAP